MTPATERAPLRAAYGTAVRRKSVMLVLMALLVAGSAIADLAVGASGIAISEVIAALFMPGSVSEPALVIVWMLRLPIALMALVVGAALALAGAEMQTILSNPLAEPFTLGVSAAAGLGAALAIVLGISIPGIPAFWIVAANAFLFALGSLVLVQFLARIRGAGPEFLILFGIVIGFAAGAILSMIQFVASAEALQQLVFWGMGSFARVDWQAVAVVTAVLAVTAPFSFAASGKLTVLRLGQDRARSLGVDVTRLRLL